MTRIAMSEYRIAEYWKVLWSVRWVPSPIVIFLGAYRISLRVEIHSLQHENLQYVPFLLDVISETTVCPILA